MEKRMRLRSAVPAEEKLEAKKPKVEEDEEDKPFITYNGKTEYHTTFIDCAIIFDKLLTQANKAEDLLILGFDMEWPFNYQTGPGKTAVIQISPSLDTCYVLHVSEIKNLPKGCNELLIHPKVRLVGVNIKTDVRKLARDFKGMDGDSIVNNCIDCGVYGNSVLKRTQRVSMEILVNDVFKMRINKDKRVRCSKWNIIPLSQEQLIYAATDAYVSLKLYLHLKEMENMENAKNAENIV